MFVYNIYLIFHASTINMECFQINKNDKKYIMNHEPQFFLYPVPMSHCTYLYYHLTYHKLWAVAMTSLLCQQLFPINIVPKHLCEQNNCVRYSWTCTFTQDSHLPFQKKKSSGTCWSCIEGFCAAFEVHCIPLYGHKVQGLARHEICRGPRMYQGHDMQQACVHIMLCEMGCAAWFLTILGALLMNSIQIASVY